MPRESQPGCDLVRQEEALANTPLLVTTPGWKTFHGKWSFAKNMQRLIAFEHFQHRNEPLNLMFSAGLGKLKQLVSAVARTGVGKPVPWGKFKCDFPESPTPFRICPCMQLSHVLCWLCCHHAHGISVTMVLLCHLSSSPRAATQMDVEKPLEDSKTCKLRGNVAWNEFFAQSIPTVF